MANAFPKILAIDYGTQRVGLALSYGTLAEPLTILENTDHLFQKIVEIIKEHDVEKVVVGISENEMAKKSQEFVEKLKTFITQSVEFIDETLSSYTVQRKLRETGKRLLSRKGPIDHYAAAEFLQTYLDDFSNHE